MGDIGRSGQNERLMSRIRMIIIFSVVFWYVKQLCTIVYIDTTTFAVQARGSATFCIVFIDLRHSVLVFLAAPPMTASSVFLICYC